MPASSPRLADALLRYASPFSRLRALPILSHFLRYTKRALASADAPTWAQIESGPSAGLWIAVHSSNAKLVLQGEYEPQVQKALADRLRPGMTFYEVGANVGFFSLLALRLVGEDGRAFLFEQDPVLFRRLRLNLARNGFLCGVCEEKAVRRESTSLQSAHAPLSGVPGRGLGPIAGDEIESGSTCVESVSIDDYCSSHPAPDFIQCEVEGTECEVFQGSANTLRQWHPTIVCEMHSTENHFALTRYFLDFGYTCHALGPHHVLAVLE